MKRIFSLLLCLALLAGCASGTAAPAASAAQPQQQGNTTLSWYVHYNWYTTPWGGNTVSDAITARTGTDINFISPDGNESEKLAALIASGSLPDLITIGWWEPQMQTLIEQGYVVALNQLADESCPAFYDEAEPTVLRWYTQADGNVYCYPNSSYLPEDYEAGYAEPSNQTFLVRKDIYEAIGSPDMTTPEGFYNAVKAAAAAYPMVEGGPLIPVGAHAFTSNGCDSFDKFLMNFLAVPYEQDGQVYDRYTDPDYLTWLKMFRRLGEEGYLSDDIFLDQRVQMDEKITQGRYFCMLYQRTDLTAAQKELYQKNPEGSYIAVDGPRNAAGDPHTLPGGGITGWTVTMISKNCAQPQKALELMTFLMSEEGQKLISVGVEGENYTMVDGKAIFTPETQQLYDTDYDAFVAKVGADDTYWMLQNNSMQARWRTAESDAALAQMREWAAPYTIYTAQYDLALTVGSEADLDERSILALWGKTLPHLLLAESDETFDALMADFVAKRAALGFDVAQSAKTDKMNEAKARLGMA